MKVILLQDVAKIGIKGSVVDVPNGYAMNSLIPQRKASPATGANLKNAEAKTAAVAQGAADTEAAFYAAKEALASGVSITATMNEQDHLFEAISADKVVEAAKAAGAIITAEMVEFAEPVKVAGVHEVSLVSGGHQANFAVTITKA